MFQEEQTEPEDLVSVTPDMYKACENDEFYNSDESERPSGERWAPVGANDGDNDFNDEYKCSHSMEK